MYKFITITLLSLFYTLSASAQVVDQSVLDMGLVPYKTTKKMAVEIVNNHDAPMVIIKGAVACGCTKLIFSKQPIMAGKSATLYVEFSAKDRGAFYKKIVIKSNYPDIALSVKGVVE